MKKQGSSALVPLPDYVESRQGSWLTRPSSTSEDARQTHLPQELASGGAQGEACFHACACRQVLRYIRADDQITAKQKKLRWTEARLREWPERCDVALLHQPNDEMRRKAPCTFNRSFGAIRYNGRCHAWASQSCFAGFRCDGTLLQCGSEQVRGAIVYCGCSAWSDGSLESMRHWFDGGDVTKFPIWGGKAGKRSY